MGLRDDYLNNVEMTYEKAANLVFSKSQDYASDEDPFKNFRGAAQFAGVTVEQGFLVRLGDKFARIKNLLEKGESRGAVGEAIEDTLLDAINYTCLLKTWIDLGRPEPEQQKTDQLELSFDTDANGDPGDEQYYTEAELEYYRGMNNANRSSAIVSQGDIQASPIFPEPNWFKRFLAKTKAAN